MSQYDTTLDPSVSNTSHWQLLDLVGGSKRVLDIGCSTGYLGEALVAAGCSVSGIEYDEAAAEKARAHLDPVVVADLDRLDFVDSFEDASFDVLVLGDVLEHLADPVAVLRTALRLLAPGGSVVISVPNVTHGSVRLALLQGRWQYTETGLLDRTHIRFFTRSSLHALLAEAGLVAVDLRGTTADPLGVEVEVDASRLPQGVVDWVREQPDALVYQFVLRAVRDDSSGAVEAARREREELRQRVAVAEGHAARLQAELERTRADVVQLQSTRTMRLLRVPRALYGRLRSALGGSAR